MGYNQAYSAYQKTNITTASQGHLIVLLYEAAVKNLKNALSCFEEDGKIHVDSIEKFSNCIQKTQAIISELQVSLDMEKGGEISKNLMSLYIFFNSELLDATFKHDKKKIENIHTMMSDLLSAWRTAAASTANAPAQETHPALNIEG